MKKYITNWRHAESTYFREASEEILATNLSMLLLSGAGGTFLLSLLYVCEPILVEGFSFTLECAASLAAFAAFFAVALVLVLRDDRRFPLIQLLCTLFCLFVPACVSFASTFGSPSVPQVFFSLVLIGVSFLFVLPAGTVIFLLTLAEGVFIFMASNGKAAAALGMDLFSSLAAYLFSLLIAWRSSRGRLKAYLSKARYQKRSTFDSLTGILNKSACEQNCGAYLSTRDVQDVCALLVIDLDDFKHINDTYGHQSGDKLLGAVGETLLKEFRSSDIVGRFGGDEFCVLMKNAASTGTIKRKTRSIQLAIQRAAKESIDVAVGCSIGVAISPKAPIDYETMFKLADGALYAAKKNGKHCSVIRNADGTAEL